MIMYSSDRLKIIAVTSRQLCPRPLWEQIPRIRQAGISSIILREKDLSEDDYLRLAEKVFRVCVENNVELTIHNYPQVAKKLGISRIHMPLPLLNVNTTHEFETAGTSIHSLEQLKQAESLNVSYVTCGHIFATDCKKGLNPRGISFLYDICNESSVPVFAIGGITKERISEISETGAAGACIMSSAMLL